MPPIDSFWRCRLVRLIVLAGSVSLSAAQGLAQDRAENAKTAPGIAREERWLAQRQERIARLNNDQRRRVEEAMAKFQDAKRLPRQSDYGRTEPLLRQAAQTLKELLGEDDPFYLICINDLAVLCQDTGDYPQAIRLLEPLPEAVRKQVGEMHYLYGQMLHNLGDVLNDMGDLRRAEPLLLRSLEVLRQTLGEKNQLYSQNLANLATLYTRKRDYARAEEMQQRNLDVIVQAGQKDSLAYAVALGNLAIIYQARGDFERAEKTLARAQQLREKFASPDWPVPGTWQANLGALYYDKKDFAKAARHLQQSLRITHRHFEATVLAQSERRQLNLAGSLRHRLDLYLSLALETHLPAEQVYEEILAFKGIVFAQQHWARLARHQSADDAETKRLAEDLQKTARELSATTFAPLGAQKAQARQDRIQQLSERKELLEAELAQRSATFAGQQALLRPNLARLRDALPSGVALLDFFEFEYRPPAAQHDRSNQRQWRVLAVVVRPDRPLQWQDLGSAQTIARACTRWRAELAAEESASGTGLPAAGAELRRLVWQPVEPLLEGSRAVLLSPDGPLACVPLAALPGAQPDTFLIEERAFATLPVPQLAPQVLAGSREPEPAETRRSLFLLGDVDFGAPPKQGTGTDPGPELRAARGSGRLDFPRLAGTALEIESIRGFFAETFPGGVVSEVRRSDASKQAFVKQVSGKRYLHVATHGFFAQPELQSGLTRPQLGEGVRRRPLGYHPGVLSGLALAGAGREAQPGDGGDGGILTALEVASLDLSEAELVVLSACETGLGGAAGGEGLLGLQRAFQIAGARSVIASLWKVDDEVTQRLMRRFYSGLWQERLPPLEALRRAQLDILHQASDPTRERAPGPVKPAPQGAVKGRTHPRLWAAWVLSGDPGDLTQLSVGQRDEESSELAASPADPVADTPAPLWPISLVAGLLAGLLLLLAATRVRRQRYPAA